MAKRPIFMPDPGGQLVREQEIDFRWYPGFSIQQKQRSVRSLHRAAKETASGPNGGAVNRILEVSSKSEGPPEVSAEPLGRRLSAFRLHKTLPDGRKGCLEAAFHASKVFERDQQLEELYWNRDGRDVKRIMRPWREVRLTMFRFGADEWPLEPKSAFYDWLYIRALQEHPPCEGVEELLKQQDAFTDIEFNPKRSFNCQARSCALFVALASMSLLSETSTRDGFLKVLADHDYGSGSKGFSEAAPQTAALALTP